jgi:hypothetical protein
VQARACRFLTYFVPKNALGSVGNSILLNTSSDDDDFVENYENVLYSLHVLNFLVDCAGCQWATRIEVFPFCFLLLAQSFLSYSEITKG